MTEKEFLCWMFEKFNLSDFSIEYQTPKYHNGLLDNIDFYKLKQYVEFNYKSMPTVHELNRIARLRHYLFEKTPTLLHLQEIKNTPRIDMMQLDEPLKEKIKNFCKKYGIKTVLLKNEV